MKGFKEPVTEEEKAYTKWQEAARKDIERAFGVLQSKFQWIARPIHLYDLGDISNRVGTCLILHNMCVSDRIMDGDVHARYNPCNKYEEEEVQVLQPPDLTEQQEQHGATSSTDSVIGIANAPDYVQRLLVQKKEWNQLQDQEEHY